MLSDVVGSLATRGGYTPAEIEAMYLTDAQDLFDYWRRVPPLRDIVAGFAGVTDQPRRPLVVEPPPELPEFED